MKKDAKIGLAIILGAVLLSALLIGKALQRQEKRSLEIPDAIEQVDGTPKPSEASEGLSAGEGVAERGSSGSASSAIDRLVAGEGGSDLPPAAPVEDSGTPSAVTEDGALAEAGSRSTVPAPSAGGGSAAFGLAGNVGGETGGSIAGTQSPAAGSSEAEPPEVPVEETPTESAPAPAEAGAGSSGEGPGVDEPRPAENVTPPATPAVGPAVSETAPAAGSAFAYTVQEGDSAWKLAKRFYGNGLQYPRIKKANPGVNFDNLKVGTKLTIPERRGSGASPSATAPAQGAPVATGTGRVHTVAPGDRLYVIAAEYLGSGMRYREIVALNPGLDPRNLKVGQKIKIPAR